MAADTMVSTHQPAWGNVGAVVPYKIYDPAEALELAGANWRTIRQRPSTLVEVSPGEFVQLEAHDKWMILKHPEDTEPGYLGTVGNVFQDLQNPVAFDWFKPYLAERDAYIVTAGVLNGGRDVWIMARIEGTDAEVVEGDHLEQRLVLSIHHHSDRGRDRVLLTNERVECANSLAAAINESNLTKKFMSFGHTKKGHRDLADIHMHLDLARRTFQADVELYRSLAQQQITTNEFRVVLEQLYAKELSVVNDAGEPRHTLDTLKATSTILTNFDQSPDLQKDLVRGTRYAAYNAITEWHTHQSVSTRRVGRSGRDRSEAQLDYLWYGQGERDIKAGLEALLAF
jgi:phage/plasmid-like protein (TIGR03299 family)